MNKKVMFDMDEVLADTITPWLKLYNEDFKDNLTSENITDWSITKFVKPEAKIHIFDYFFKKGFYMNHVKPHLFFLEMAKVFIKKGFNVGIATSCSNNFIMIEEKIKWLRKYCPFISEENFVFLDNKGNLQADVLIDDRMKNLKDFLHVNHNSTGLLVESRHNKKDFEDLKDDIYWRDRIEIIRGWKNLE